MYKFDNDMLPDVINNLYKKNKDVHSHYTRGNNLLRIPRGTLNFTNVSARVWNILMLKIDIHVSLPIFKRTVKTYLLNNSIELKYTR